MMRRIVYIRVDNDFLKIEPILLLQQHIKHCPLKSLDSGNALRETPVDRDYWKICTDIFDH